MVVDTLEEVERKKLILSKICFIFAEIFGWGAFSIGITAVPNGQWAKNYETGYSIGLWKLCNQYNDSKEESCSPPESSSWINTSRVFMILFVVFTFVAGMISELKVHIKKARQISGNIFSLSGTFGTIAVTVFGSNLSQKHQGFHLITGYVMAAVASGLSYIAGLAMQLSASKLPVDNKIETTNKWQPPQNSFGHQIGNTPPPPPPPTSMPPPLLTGPQN